MAVVVVRRNSSTGAAAAASGAGGAWHNVTSAPLRDITHPGVLTVIHLLLILKVAGGTVVVHDGTTWPQRDITPSVLAVFHLLDLSYLFKFCIFSTTMVDDKSDR